MEVRRSYRNDEEDWKHGEAVGKEEQSLASAVFKKISDERISLCTSVAS